MTAPDPVYTDPRLTAVYDSLNPFSISDRYYMELAGPERLGILDIGCGTGQLAVRLAQAGHDVTGADPAAAMLDIGRSRPGGKAVHWIQSDAAHLDVARRFDLIIMTGHAFQTLLSDDAVQGALVNLRRHLAPGGRLAFETRNPLVREWEEWTPQRSSETVEVPGVGPVTVHNSIAKVEDDRVTFLTHFQFGPNDVRVEPSTIRFMTREAVEGALDRAGFTHKTWHGSWDKSPLDDGSIEIIVVAG